MRDVAASFYPEMAAGGFSKLDGTVEFYSRVNALLRPDMTVVDLGAGRGIMAETDSAYRRSLATLRGKVARVIGVDVDPVVKSNPLIDEAIVYDGGAVPLPDSCADLIISDWTLEHVTDPEGFAREVRRLLRPTGWFCARTPHLYSLAVLAAVLIPNRKHAGVVSKAQPGGREAGDVYPTAYKLNTRAALDRYFGDHWRNYSYTSSPEPPYHFNNKLLFAAMSAYQYIKKPFLGGECLNVFLQK